MAYLGCAGASANWLMRISGRFLSVTAKKNSVRLKERLYRCFTSICDIQSFMTNIRKGVGWMRSDRVGGTVAHGAFRP
jgi:hypothetical protein